MGHVPVLNDVHGGAVTLNVDVSAVMSCVD